MWLIFWKIWWKYWSKPIFRHNLNYFHPNLEPNSTRKEQWPKLMKRKIILFCFRWVFKDDEALQSTSVKNEWIRRKNQCEKKDYYLIESLCDRIYEYRIQNIQSTIFIPLNNYWTSCLLVLVTFRFFFAFHFLLSAFHFVLFHSVLFWIIINCPIRANGRLIGVE